MKVRGIQPSCPRGFTVEDILLIFPDEEQRKAFGRWMNGQTIGNCDGVNYDYENHRYVESECGGSGHGWTYYTYDVNRYVTGIGRNVFD